jgi:hypothetical protein
MRILLFAAIGLVVGCGGGGGSACESLSGSCTQATGLFCTEYGGVPADQLATIMSSCTRADPDGKSTWSSSGCNTGNSIGACKKTQGGVCVAVWLSSSIGGVAAEAMKMCSDQGGTWVSP